MKYFLLQILCQYWSVTEMKYFLLQILCQYLLSLTLTGTRPIAKQYKHIIKESQALVTRLLQEGVVKHFEMLSLDLLSNGLNAIIEMGAVTKEKR
jgi:glycerone phosphate O-acyltransferase